jgi:hypothetical protein
MCEAPFKPQAANLIQAKAESGRLKVEGLKFKVEG